MPPELLVEDVRRLVRGASFPGHRTPRVRSSLHCPACGSSDVAAMLGDNGGVSYVCTACGHSWS